MPHKYLPHAAGGVRPAALLCAAAAGVAACADPTDPGDGPGGRDPGGVELLAPAPAGDTVSQLGFDLAVHFRDRRPIGGARIVIDSGTPQQTNHGLTNPLVWRDTATVRWPVALPTPGAHTFTVTVYDTTGRAATLTFARTAVVPEAAYAAAVLPADGGTNVEVRGISVGGAVAGRLVDAAGRRRPAVWRDGVLALVPTPGDVNGGAVQTNAAGDVLLELDRSDGRGVVVRRADGSFVTVGPLGPRYAPSPGTPPATTCCRTAAALTERRQALAYGPELGPPFGSAIGRSVNRSVVVDVGTGAVVDSANLRVHLLNEAGQTVGTNINDFSWSYVSRTPVPLGFTLGAAPTAGAVYPRCDPPGRYSTEDAVGLDDAGNVLTVGCVGAYFHGPIRGDLTYYGAGGASVRLTTVLGSVDTPRLSPRGGWVVGLQPATGTLYRWQAATRRVERVRVAGDWRITALGGVNADGRIAAVGVDAATGASSPLLLTPAP